MTPRTLHPLAAALLLTLLAAPACSREAAPSSGATADNQVATPGAAAARPAASSGGGATGPGKQDEEASTRKVIRNAELTVQVSDGPALKARATRLMDQLGGYVAGSTEKHSETDEGWSVQMTLKVPVGKLDTALAELRGYGDRVVHENVSSQDVTAEFFDLEARLRAQRAVEVQMMAIAKEAKTVTDLLEVQKRLGDVRVEIERMEGRRNQLEHQASLSTIQLIIQRPTPPRPPPVVADGSMMASVNMAVSDALGVGRGLVHGTIRLVGVVVPLALFFGPLIYGLRYLRRWRAARQLRAPLAP